MNILVIGLGSMGKRRIRLLKNSFDIHSIVGVDMQEVRREFSEAEYNIKTYPSIDEAVYNSQFTIHNSQLGTQLNVSLDRAFHNGFDAAFVCTAPLTHFEIINQCLDNNLNVFSEINLVSDGYDILIKKAKENNLKLFLSSTPLYRGEIRYISKRVKENHQPLNYIYHVGQYLPDWHPWESYKDFFIGDSRTNGCREIFAIELPWIADAFGEIESIHSVKSKNTGLDIDYPDNYMVTLTHKSGHKGVVCFDVVSRKAVRRFEVFGETLHIFWNGTPETLSEFDIERSIKKKINTYENVEQNRDYSESIIENMYIDEVADFIDYVNGKSVPLYSFEKDVLLLNIIDQIERGSPPVDFVDIPLEEGD